MAPQYTQVDQLNAAWHRLKIFVNVSGPSWAYRLQKLQKKLK